MGKVSVVVFDMDGVLCNIEESSRMAAVDVFAEIEVLVTTEDFVPFIGTVFCYRCGKYPPVVKTAVLVDGRFEHNVISCNTTEDHEIVWIEKEAQRALDVNEEANDKVLEVEQKYNEIRKPVYKKRNEVIQSISDFWLTAFLSHPSLGDLLTGEDQKATELRHPSGCAMVSEMTKDIGKWKHLIDKANTK